MEQNLHANHRGRLRERYLKDGMSGFLDHQVLELLLTYSIPRKDTNPTAHLLLKHFGSLAGVFDAGVNELMKVKGVGESTAIFLNMLPLIFAKYRESSNQPKPVFTTHKEIQDFVRELYSDSKTESVYLISLNEKGGYIHHECLATGRPDHVFVEMRNICEAAFKTKAYQVVITHNHPNGTAHPSMDDNGFTKSAVTALHINGIKVLDHLIVGKAKDVFSYSASGMLDAIKKKLN